MNKRYGSKSNEQMTRQPRYRFPKSILVLAAVIGAVSPAYAQQVIVINDAQTATNGGATIDGNDRLTITGSGSISPPTSAGVDVDGDNNVVTNFGLINPGVNRDGIDVVSGTGNQVLNFGTVVSSSNAVELRGDSTTFLNFGSVVADVNGSRGIQIGATGVSVTNFGTVLTQDSSADAIQFIGTTTGSVFTNFGSVLTEQAGADVIEIRSDDNVIVNAGSLVAVNADALLFGGGAENNIVRLLAPGFIGGAIDFSAATNTTIDIVTGPSQSNFWTLEGTLVGGAPNIFGTVPVFYNAAAQTVATFDPTILASEFNTLGDVTFLMSQAGLGAIDGLEPQATSAPFGSPEALGFLPFGIRAEPDSSSQVWFTALGAERDYDGGDATLDSTNTYGGLAAGYSWQAASDLTLNATAGYIYGEAEANARFVPSFDSETHTFFVGLQGQRPLGWSALPGGLMQFGLSAGYMHTDQSRLINDNLAPLGQSRASADYDGFFLASEIGVSTDISLSDRTLLTPKANVRYAAQWLDGYTETGALNAAANAAVDDRFVSVLETELGLDASRTFQLSDWTTKFTGRIGYLGRWDSGDDDTTISLNGITGSVASNTQDLNAAFVGASLRSNVGDATFVVLDSTYLLGDTAEGLSGRIAFEMTF